MPSAKWQAFCLGRTVLKRVELLWEKFVLPMYDKIILYFDVHPCVYKLENNWRVLNDYSAYSNLLIFAKAVQTLRHPGALANSLALNLVWVAIQKVHCGSPFMTGCQTIDSVSLWDLTGTLVALLPRRLSNFDWTFLNPYLATSRLREIWQ